MDDKKPSPHPTAGPSTPLPTRKRGPNMMTPNLFSAAKRRRMSLADEDRSFDELGAAGWASSSKVDMVSVFWWLYMGVFRCCDGAGVAVVGVFCPVRVYWGMTSKTGARGSPS